MLQDAEGGKQVVWFIDASEAENMLQLITAGNPDTEGLRLHVMPLGTVFKLCKGWPSESNTAISLESSEDESYFKLQGAQELMAEFEPILQAQLRDQGVDPGNWQLPVFVAQEFVTESMLPVFFSREDLKAGWVRAGRPEDECPKQFTVMDLRTFCVQMQSDNPAWRTVQLIPSVEAFKLANALRERNAADAAMAKMSDGAESQDELEDLETE